MLFIKIKIGNKYKTITKEIKYGQRRTKKDS